MTQQTNSETRPTPTIEDYLTIMFIIERDGEEIIAARLAESLEVTPPTVTMTLKRMERDGWIEIKGRKEIHLTPSGCEAASSVLRRHMLTEWMLARILKVPWSEVHSEAHSLEHSISDHLADQMEQNFDDPLVCPHGNPLPGNEYITAPYIGLIQMEAGEHAVIRRIHENAENDAKLLQYLETNGLVPGAEVEISEVLPFNQTITLDLAGKKVVLGYPAAKQIFVEKL